jgi:hypothetical protein
MRPLLLCLVFLCAADQVAAQQTIPPLTTERIQQAIAEVDAPSYQIELSEWPFTPVLFDTPYSRVASAAVEAKKAYRPFTEAQVTQEQRAPRVNVIAIPALVPPPVLAKRSTSDVVAIVLMPIGSTDRSRAILPLSQRAVPNREAGGMGMVAVFHVSDMRDGNEVRVVYDQQVCAGSTPKSKALAKSAANWKLSAECHYPIKLDKVR